MDELERHSRHDPVTLRAEARAGRSYTIQRVLLLLLVLLAFALRAWTTVDPWDLLIVLGWAAVIVAAARLARQP